MKHKIPGICGDKNGSACVLAGGTVLTCFQKQLWVLVPEKSKDKVAKLWSESSAW